MLMSEIIVKNQRANKIIFHVDETDHLLIFLIRFYDAQSNIMFIANFMEDGNTRTMNF